MVKPHESWKNSIYSVFTLNNIFLHSTVIWKRCWIFVTMPLKGLCKSSFLVAQIQVVEFEPERKIFIALNIHIFSVMWARASRQHESCNFNTLLDDDTLVWYFFTFLRKVTEHGNNPRAWRIVGVTPLCSCVSPFWHLFSLTTSPGFRGVTQRTEYEEYAKIKILSYLQREMNICLVVHKSLFVK